MYANHAMLNAYVHIAYVYNRSSYREPRKLVKQLLVHTFNTHKTIIGNQTTAAPTATAPTKTI